jgi:hypothetical protein
MGGVVRESGVGKAVGARLTKVSDRELVRGNRISTVNWVERFVSAFVTDAFGRCEDGEEVLPMGHGFATGVELHGGISGAVVSIDIVAGVEDADRILEIFPRLNYGVRYSAVFLRA